MNQISISIKCFFDNSSEVCEYTHGLCYNQNWGRPGFDVGCKTKGACRA